MRSYLVLDASPDLVGVNKRQRGLAAAGPSAQQQAGFVPHGVAGTLSVGMLAEAGLEIVLANAGEHVGGGREGEKVNAGGHGVRSREFNIVSIVMRLKEASPMIGIPGANAVVQAAFGQGVHFLEPVEVTGNLPVAKDFHDSAQLAVRGGMKVVFYRAFGKRGAKRDVAVFVHRAA